MADTEELDTTDESEDQTDKTVEESETDSDKTVEKTDVEDKDNGAITALRKERDARKKIEKELQTVRQQLAAKDQTAEEAELAKIRQEATDTATKAANQRVIRSEAKLAAAKKFTDPALAVRLLDLESIDVDEDGEVDEASLTAALDELLVKHPSLAVGKSAGSADQGMRGKSATIGQLTEADLNKMSAEQINKSRKEGRLKTLLG